MKEATSLFSKKRAAEAKALVQISRELDRPGILGVFTFIMPLVIDSICNKIAPGIFSPNTIAMLQKSENSFCGLRRRKRWERLGQVSIIGTFLTGLTYGAGQLIKFLTRVTGKQGSTVTASLAAGLAAITLAKKVAVFLLPGLAPADVLNKASSGKSNKSGEETPLQTITAYKDEDPTSNMAGGGI